MAWDKEGVVIIPQMMNGLRALAPNMVGLRKKFYKISCPAAEDIVRNVTWRRAATSLNLPAKLLRTHFHGCFVRGCDASVLVNSTANNTAEKDAIPNLSLEGFDVIDEIKTQLENTCPGKVSCADILALSARDSVAFQVLRAVQKPRVVGRRDGIVSEALEAFTDIPSPFFNFWTPLQSFKSKGLSVHDLVVLSGGHTIGAGHCNLVSNRLYNFTGKGDQDPSLNPTYVAFLKNKCKILNEATTTVEIDPGSSQNFDTAYFATKQRKGLFQSDAALLTNRTPNKIVGELLNSNVFFREFAQPMKRMGAIGVLPGTSGEIRKKCSVINS
uniref:Peroxidase n=1 Tax=Populus trichocarpa TaxID=3694 RepID=W8PWI2_POPTR|nr:class III peroxidase [Populus trichocarpa]